MSKMLKTQVKDFLLQKKEERKNKRDSFWCTESETNFFDLYHKFKGTKETNPMTVEDAFGLGMRKKLEDAVVDNFKEMGIWIDPTPYEDREGNMIEEPDQHRVDMERNGVRITGYMDAIIKEKTKFSNEVIDNLEIEVGIPVEIKTSYGLYQKKELQKGLPKLSYLKQLAQYMDFLSVKKGHLFQVHFEKDLIIDDIYQFTLVRDGDIFKCGIQEFNINDVYNRYKEVWDKYISKDIEPESEFTYKYDLDSIDWKTISKTQISGARNNKAVIGDWQVKYSSYKDLIVKKEAKKYNKLKDQYLGYDDEELQKINEATKGYTTWDKK